MPDEQYLTIQDITKRLQVSEKTVRRWIINKQLPAIVIGTRYRVKEDDLKAFLEKKQK